MRDLLWVEQQDEKLTAIHQYVFRRELALAVLLLALWAYCSYSIPAFAELPNVMDRSRHIVEIGIVAVPMTLVIATGGIDLSVASIVAMAGMIGGALWQQGGLNIWTACGVMIAVGTLAGVMNGTLSAYLRLAPLVVTLATMAAYRGVAMVVTRGRPIGGLPDSFTFIGSGELPGTIIPVQWLVLAAAFIIGVILLNRSWIGAHLLGMGENWRAAIFAACPVRGLTVFLYGFAGFWCGVVAPIYLARNQTALPNMKVGMELDVIAAVVVGGTRITGGQATMLGTLLGVLLLGTLQYGMDMAETADRQPMFLPAMQKVITGAVVVAAAVMNEVMARRQERIEATASPT